MDNLTTPGVGGISGLAGVALGWLGFKGKIKDIERRIERLSGSVRYEDTCNGITKALNCRLKAIEGMNTEMRKDIKELLKRK